MQGCAERIYSPCQACFFPVRAPISDETSTMWNLNGGEIDNLRIWNSPSAQEEIRSTLYSHLTRKNAGLVGYWDSNQNGSDTEILDRTSNGTDGRIFGGVKFVTADSL